MGGNDKLGINFAWPNFCSVHNTQLMSGNNLSEPEMSVLIPEYRGVHILQVSNDIVYKSMEENLGP